MESLYLGIEIGGTKQQIAIGNGEGKILEKVQTNMICERGALDILDWLHVNISNLLNKKKEYKLQMKKVGIGFGGPLESSTGRILSSLQVTGWKDFNLKEWFEVNFNLPTIVINDTVAGGFAELLCGTGRESTNFFYTNIGTGIGGGLFVNREYYDGSGYGASYLGNTLIPDWTVYSCGASIRLESICSGRSIEKRLCRRGYVPKESLLYELCAEDITKVSCMDLAKAVRFGDEFAIKELNSIAKSFSIGLANYLAIVSPDTITIGGGVAKMGDILFERIEKYTDQLVFIANKNQYKILQSVLVDDAVLVGAILYAANKSLEEYC